MNAKVITVASPPDDGKCKNSRVQNGTLYRCSKDAGHENVAGDEICEAQAMEYAYRTDLWKTLSDEAAPLLEWMAKNPNAVGSDRAEAAARVLVKRYMSTNPGPHLAKTKITS